MDENDLSCDFCDARVLASELETGGAVVLLGKTFCPRCLEETIRNSKSGVPTPPAKAIRTPVPARTRDLLPSEASAGPAHHPSSPEHISPEEDEEGPGAAANAERRGDERYIPPLDCELVLRPSGLGGFLIGNVVKHWLEISPNGLRAVVSRKLLHGDLLEARIAIKARREVFTAQVLARHVSESQKYPGSFVVGFKFVVLSDAARTCMKQDLCRFPAAPGGPPKHLTPRPRAADKADQAADEVPGKGRG